MTANTYSNLNLISRRWTLVDTQPAVHRN